MSEDVIVMHFCFAKMCLLTMPQLWCYLFRFPLVCYMQPPLVCLIMVYAAGTRAVGESDDLVAWDTQASVPLPDINAKNKA